MINLRPAVDVSVGVELGGGDRFRVDHDQDGTFVVFKFRVYFAVLPDGSFWEDYRHARGYRVRRDGSVGDSERNVYGLLGDEVPADLREKILADARSELAHVASTNLTASTLTDGSR